MFENKPNHYNGTESYKFIDKLVFNNDKNLMIISPFISASYLKKLIDLSKKKKIFVVTSEKGVNEDQIKGYLSKKFRTFQLLLYSLIVFIFALAISLYLKLALLELIFTYLDLIILIFLLLVYWLNKNKKARNYKNIQFKIVKEKFIHEKVYIGDSEAITGSANFTYSGLHKNLEQLDIIKDKGEIEKLKKHFQSIWNSY